MLSFLALLSHYSSPDLLAASYTYCLLSRSPTDIMIASAFPSMLLFLTSLVSAKTVSYDWDVTWVTAAPDGFARAVIGVNGKWPCPPINADVGDTVVVTLNNLLGNETTGLHFHGIRQLHTNDMDGNSGATQCPVPPGSSITYKFLVCPL